MADIAKLTFDNVEFNIKDTVARRNSSFYIKGTQSQTTSNWTGTSDSLINLYEGLCIDYQLPYPSTTSDATFNLTFRNGTSTGSAVQKAAHPQLPAR